MTSDTLSDDDRKDFRRRLASYDLDEDAVIADELTVPAGEMMHLEMVDRSAIRPYILQTRSLDKVREWVGVPTIAAKRLARQPMQHDRGHDHGATEASRSRKLSGGPVAAPLPAAIDARALHAAVERCRCESAADGSKPRLKSTELDTLRLAARSYVRGDAELVAEFKPAIEAYFQNFQIAAWLFTTVRVKKNSTLVFGTGTHVLSAGRVVIEPGGRILAHGNLTVNATQLQKQRPLRLTLPDSVLTGPLRRTHF